MTKVLIVEARYYDHIADLLLDGAVREMEAAGVVYHVITVPGALEIPAGIRCNLSEYDGYVALGCVIRGETYHFEIVANESARGLMEMAVHLGLAIGNGILTVENEEQAISRAGEMDKGGDAARACLKLIELQKSGTS